MSKMIFNRVFGWLANEFVTKRLANSETFQSAAHKLHQNVSSNPLYKQLAESQKPKYTRPIDPYRISSYHQPKPQSQASQSAFASLNLKKVQKFASEFQSALSSELSKMNAKSTKK
ncbi:hypothetical protein MP228_010977 [Amoeboaphelidium protococcarum]|nr:hypothetical protein MP228_010977 [Amoeboaphelidium protococcarum]